MQAYNGQYSIQTRPQRELSNSIRPSVAAIGDASSDGASTVRGRASQPAPVVMIGVILAVALMAVIPHVFSMALTPPVDHYIEVTVMPGQTLWQIAAEHKDARADTRRMIDRIRTANELSGASLRPGQVLRIPVAP